jgi:hypothetical protein
MHAWKPQIRRNGEMPITGRRAGVGGGCWDCSVGTYWLIWGRECGRGDHF